MQNWNPLYFDIRINLEERQALTVKRAFEFLAIGEGPDWKAFDKTNADKATLKSACPDINLPDDRLSALDRNALDLALRVYREILFEIDNPHTDGLMTPGSIGGDNRYEFDKHNGRDYFEIRVDDDETGQIDVAIGVVKAVQEHFQLGPIGFEWASSGKDSTAGAVFIAPGRRPEHSQPPYQWLEERQKAYAEQTEVGKRRGRRSSLRP